MRAGRLDRKITIQRKTVTQDDSGATVDSWSAVVQNRAASVEPVSGDERFSGEQYVAKQQTEFRIRWSSEVEGLSPLDRVVYPSDHADDSPVPDSSIYDIMAVHELGRHEGLRVLTARRSS